MDIKELQKIYTSYGFEIDIPQEDIAVFLYKKGRYFGADIIPLNNDPETFKKANSIKDTYSGLGYATTLKNVKCIEEAEEELFKSFFSFESTKERLKKKYFDFEKKQTANLLGNSYKYIECPYEIYESDEERNGFILHIKNIIINQEKPHLIIIEAAAGYGKTSTAFEILNALVNDNKVIKMPIVTELARNRGAKIFRYILLDEIDIEFPSLNSDLVIKEIKSGRIPLIIDGFDELLDKINLEADISTLDEVEPMLNTIGNLLEGEAKIILTTRKTAIFNGAEFERWYSKWHEKFSVTRVSIKEPKILDWLGLERVNLLEQKNVQINAIANPVILTYLKNLNSTDFENQITNSENLVNQYFEKMLEREKERQNLYMTVQDQYEIFKNVVRLLLELDSSVESKEFFKEIIKEQNLKLLETVRTHYPERPTVDNLVDSLATHALLDRKGRDGNQIGFINDFVFGTFIGDIISDTMSSDIDNNFSSYMIELAVTAYKVQNQLKRVNLWEKLMDIKHKFTPYTIFNFDIILRNEIVRNYIDLVIKEYGFYNINFVGQKVQNSVFVSCYFKNCYFENDTFNGVSFINCIFESCSIKDGIPIDLYADVSIIKCAQKNCFVLNEAEYYEPENENNYVDDLQRTILHIIWTFSIHKKYQISNIIQKVDGKPRKQISTALLLLESQKFIHLRGSNVEFNINKISEIKQILNKD